MNCLNKSARIVDVAAMLVASILAAGCGGGSGDDSGTPPIGNDKPPEATITVPANGATFKAGDTISFEGSAVDAEDGTLPATRLNWRVDLHRGEAVQPVSSNDAAQGGEFVVPVLGLGSADFFYRIRLIATDSKGQVSEVVRDLLPLKAEVTLKTEPAAFSLMLDGQFVSTPHVFQGVVGSARQVVAADELTVNGTHYRFTAWSDAGASTHTIVVPQAATQYTASFAVVGPEINLPPSVSLQQPAAHDGSLPIQVTAVASDADGSVAQVQLFDGATLVGTDNSAPYVFDWRPATAGTHVLKAQAIDDRGAITVSSVINVQVAAAPVSLTVPAVVALNTSVQVEVSTDKPETIVKVDLLDGSTLVGSLTSSPFLFSWTPSSLGEHGLTASVTNVHGIVNTRYVKVKVQADPPPPPVVTLASPATATLGTMYLLTVDFAGDPGISNLELFDGSEKVLLGAYSSKILKWKPMATGERLLMVRAVSNEGGVIATSAVMPVNVVAPPTSLPTPPTSAQVSLWAGKSGGQGRYDGESSLARFNAPAGLAIDGLGNRYVADRQNAQIRRIEPNGTTAKLVVTGPGLGGALGHFYRPSGLALDASGDLFVADELGQRIRKIQLADGKVTTVVGTSNVGTGDGSDAEPARLNHPVAVAYLGNRLLVLDRDNHAIREMVGHQRLAPFAGAAGNAGFAESGVQRSDARFLRPNAMAVDQATGAVLVMDQGNCVLRIIEASGTVRNLAGANGDCRSVDGGPDVSRVDPSSSLVPGPMPDVGAIVALGNGKALFGDRAGLREVNIADGSVRTLQLNLPEPGTGVIRPWPAQFVSGLLLETDGSVLVSSQVDHAVLRFQPSASLPLLATVVAGQPAGSGVPILPAPILRPQDINLGINGSVLVSSRQSGGVQRITAAGTVETLIDESSEPGLRVIRLAEGNNGMLYVATEPKLSGGEPLVEKSFRGYSQGQLVFSLKGFDYVPASGIAVDSQGRAVYTDFTNISDGKANLYRVTPDGVKSRLLAWSGFFTAVAVTNNDDIFVLADTNGSTVFGVSASVLRITMTPSGPVVNVVASEGLINARGLAADDGGNAYVALGDCRIMRLQPNGTRDVIAGQEGQCTFTPGNLAAARLPIGRGEFELGTTPRGFQSLKFRDNHLLMKMDDGIVRIGPLSTPTAQAAARRKVVAR